MTRQDMYPTPCPGCDGYGVIAYAITVYEHGCGFPHESSDERPCPGCDGTGSVLLPYEAPDEPGDDPWRQA